MDKTEIYKDKVLSYIIGKTKIKSTEDENKIIIEPPFIALQVPYHRFQLNYKSDIESLTSIAPFPVWAFFSGFKEYCEFFDLSRSELRDLFKSYNDALIVIIKNEYFDKEPITESMDKQRQFLYMVADRLVNETDIDLDNNRIHYPYGGLSTTCDGVVVDSPFIVSHLKNVYALDKKEIGEVVSMYTQFIKRKLKLVLKGGRINENVDKQKEDKQKQFLDYVYNNLVKNTKFRNAAYRDIDIFDGKCKSLQVGMRWGSESPYFNYVPECLENFLKDTYGLTYYEIQDLFWDKYEQHIINMVLSKKENVSPHVRVHVDYLRESKIDKQTEFFKKIVDTMIEETIPYNETKGSVITPFFADKNNNGRWIMSAHYCKSVIDDFDYEFNDVPFIINNYLEMFGLSYEEMRAVMYGYFKGIFEKYFKRFFDLSYRNKSKLSESVDLGFVDKVADSVLREIVWDFDRGLVYFPMINYSADIRDDDFLSAVNADDPFSNRFSGDTRWHIDIMKHIEDTYGITGNEWGRVWGSLQGEIWDKTDKYWDSFTRGY